MITLQRPDPKLCAFLGSNKGIKPRDAVIPSRFAVPLYLGKRSVIMNMLTGQCIESKYFEWFESREERGYDDGDDEMRALVKKDFLVSPALDETDRYINLIGLLRRLDRPKKEGYIGYTILPTTACNARCVYCYEEGIKYESMTDEVVERTLRYIHETRRSGSRLTFRWFGGEPLMGESIIDRICVDMREKGVNYTSTMISNGSLMTEEMTKKAKEEWHLGNIQITLDGREDVYCERKRYVSFEGSPYRATLDGIHSLLKSNIRVSIRLNADENNLDELSALVEELEEEFADEKNISIYSHGIFAGEGENSDAGFNSDALYEGMEELNEKLVIFNRKRRIPAKNGGKKRRYDRRFSVKRYYCMADNPSTGPVIMPDGKLHLCEHINERPCVGTIYDTKYVDRDAFVIRGREKEEKCRECPLLPRCTDFSDCPTIDRDCKRERMIREARNLRNLENEKRLPPVTIAFGEKIIRINEPSLALAERCTPLLADDFLKPDITISHEEAKRLLEELMIIPR